MYIRSRAAAAISDLIIGILSLIAEWYLLGRYGWTALRFFPTWVLFLSAVYFLSAALLITLRSHRDPNRKPYPMLEGMILMGFLLICGMAIASSADGFVLPRLDSWLIWLMCAGLPILIFFDWLFFAKKGHWQVMYPFYWLALPITYAATMILTAEFLPDFTTWLYPLDFLDYYNFGLWEMIGWIIVISLLVLIVGYVLYLMDFIMSGKLGNYIVLPHIQTILIDENGNPIKPEVAEPKDNNLGRYDTLDQLNHQNTPKKPKIINQDSAVNPPPKNSKKKHKKH